MGIHFKALKKVFIMRVTFFFTSTKVGFQLPDIGYVPTLIVLQYSNTPSRRTSVAGSVVSSGLSRSGGSVTDFEDNGSQYTGTDCDDENHHRSIVITDRQLNEFYQVVVIFHDVLVDKID